MVINEPIIIMENDYTLANQRFTAGPGLRNQPMVYFGGNKNAVLRNIELDCNGIAAAGISCWDCDADDLDNVFVRLPTVVGLYVVAKQSNVMGLKVDQLRVEARDVRFPQCEFAGGIILDGEDHYRANVCFCTITDARLDIDAGVAVDMRDADNVTLITTHCIMPFKNKGFALRIDKRAYNTIVGFEPHLGKVWMREREKNRVYGWSEANGAPPWPSGYHPQTGELLH